MHALKRHQEIGHLPGAARTHRILGEICRATGDEGSSASWQYWAPAPNVPPDEAAGVLRRSWRACSKMAPEAMNWPGERDGDAWVFGYGSLMWNPCFRYVESRRALLRGYHRSLCILSVRSRGTTDKPGLALGLDRGGSCNGFAFRVAAGDIAEARSLLWQREMPNDVYEPKLLPVRLKAGDRVPALAFVARREHRQYVGDLKPEHAAALVVQGVGASGTALDYLRKVVVHLDDFGIADCPLHRVLELAETMSVNRHGIGPPFSG